MGSIFAPATLFGPRGGVSVKFLIDSGASYTVLPYVVWTRLGIKAAREMTFTLADGTEVKRSISECRIRLKNIESHTPVVLGERKDSPLLGVITLEIMGLMLNPFTRTLEPMKMMMASSVGPAAYA